jgi:hypothetical protein
MYTLTMNGGCGRSKLRQVNKINVVHSIVNEIVPVIGARSKLLSKSSKKSSFLLKVPCVYGVVTSTDGGDTRGRFEGCGCCLQ